MRGPASEPPPAGLPPSAAPVGPPRPGWMRFGRAALQVAVLGALAVVVVRERETLARGLAMSLGEFAWIAGFSVATWAVTSVAQVETLRAFATRVPLPRMFALHVVTGLLNHVPGRPGTLYRAAYLKRHGGLRYTHFGSATVVNVLIVTVALGVTGAAAVAALFGLGDLSGQGLFAAFLGLAALGVAPLLFAPRFEGRSRWPRLWNDLVDGRDRILRHPRLVAVLFACHLLSFAFGAVRYRVAFHTLDLEVGLLACLVLGAVGRLSNFLGVTPGGLGVNELVVAASGRLLGIAFATAVVAATVARAVVVVCYVFVGVPCLLALRWSDRRRDGDAPQPL